MNNGKQKTSPVINENLNLVVDENNNIINASKLIDYIKNLEYDFDTKEQLESLFQNISNNNYGNKEELEQILKEKLDEFQLVDNENLNNQSLLSSLQSENEDLRRLRYIETPKLDNDSRNYADYMEIVKKDGTVERVEVRDQKGFAEFIEEHRGEISSWTAEEIFDHFSGSINKEVEMQDEEKLLTDPGMAAQRDYMDKHAAFNDPAVVSAERIMINKYARDTNNNNISQIKESVDSRGERIWTTNGSDFVKFIDTAEGRQLVSLSNGQLDEAKKDENGNVIPNDNKNGIGDDTNYEIIPGYVVPTKAKAIDETPKDDMHHDIPKPVEQGMQPAGVEQEPSMGAMPMNSGPDISTAGTPVKESAPMNSSGPKPKKDVEDVLMDIMPNGVKFGMEMLGEGNDPKHAMNTDHNPQANQNLEKKNTSVSPKLSGTMNMDDFDALLEQRQLQGPEFPPEAEQALDNYAYIATVMLNQKIEKNEMDEELETLFNALSAYVEPLVSEFDDNMVYGAKMNIPEVQSIIMQEWPRLSEESQKLLQQFRQMPDNKQKQLVLNDPDHHGTANMTSLIIIALIGIILVGILALAIN